MLLLIFTFGLNLCIRYRGSSLGLSSKISNQQQNLLARRSLQVSKPAEQKNEKNPPRSLRNGARLSSNLHDGGRRSRRTSDSGSQTDDQSPETLFGSKALYDFFDLKSSYLESAGVARLALLGGVLLSLNKSDEPYDRLKILERKLGSLKSQYAMKLGHRSNILSGLHKDISILESDIDRVSRETNQLLLSIKMAAEEFTRRKNI